jgi:hypothetical protein
MTGIFEGIRGCDKSSWINTTRERRRWVTWCHGGFNSMYARGWALGASAKCVVEPVDPDHTFYAINICSVADQETG